MTFEFDPRRLRIECTAFSSSSLQVMNASAVIDMRIDSISIEGGHTIFGMANGLLMDIYLVTSE
jgi:hypothetical protein